MGAKVGSNLEVANGTKMFIGPEIIPANIIMHEEEMLIQSTCHYNDHIWLGS
jgi:hypothetical protein